ncbi:Transmembrane protein 47 [Dirofilaria immitis]|nr:Transmembrane protein 47 [Dirofilaria immitis]
MAVQATTIETVTVVRPLKIIALVCLLVAFVLLILCLSTTWWLRSGGFRTGLWLECTAPDQTQSAVAGGPPRKVPKIHRHAAYIKLVAAFLITAAILTFFTFFLNIFGLRTQDLHWKYVFYKFATYISLLGVFLELVSLIVFPVCFYVEMKNFGYRNWEFDWSYGVAWGATLFAFGASLLLICDKEHEEVYFKEKTIYNPPPELK